MTTIGATIPRPGLAIAYLVASTCTCGQELDVVRSKIVPVRHHPASAATPLSLPRSSRDHSTLGHARGAGSQDTISLMDLQDTLEQIRAEIAPYIAGGAVLMHSEAGLGRRASVRDGRALNDGLVHVTGRRYLVLGPEHLQVFSLAL